MTKLYLFKLVHDLVKTVVVSKESLCKKFVIEGELDDQ